MCHSGLACTAAAVLNHNVTTLLLQRYTFGCVARRQLEPAFIQKCALWTPWFIQFMDASIQIPTARSGDALLQTQHETGAASQMKLYAEGRRSTTLAASSTRWEALWLIRQRCSHSKHSSAVTICRYLTCCWQHKEHRYMFNTCSLVHVHVLWLGCLWYTIFRHFPELWPGYKCDFSTTWHFYLI